MTAQGTRFCFTVNNYTQEGHESLCVALASKCRYYVVGKEVGEQGTPHLQCFCILKKNMRKKAFTKFIETAADKHPWTNLANGTNDEAADYCKKEGNYIEEGSYPKGRGTRSDIADFMAAVKDNQDDDILMDMFPTEWCKYYKAADRARSVLKRKRHRRELEEEYAEVSLRAWQKVVIRKLLSQNDRKVTWVYDPTGNIGKSWLAGYLVVNHHAFLVEGGKRADVAYAYDNQEIVVFDYTRSQEEQVNYSLIESFKNGRIFSSKYESHLKIFKKAKVLCLSNFDPDRSKLSADRWQVLEFNPPQSGFEPPRKKPRLSRNNCECEHGPYCNQNCS